MSAAATKPERRELQLNSLDEIVAEAERLAAAPELEFLGNWSLGQMFDHVARAMDATVDGVSFKLPLMARLFLPLMRGKMLRDLEKGGAMPAGFQLPKAAEPTFVPPDDVTTEEGLEHLRSAVARLKARPERPPHFVFGKLTDEQNDLVQRRHAEMHFSHALPRESERFRTKTSRWTPAVVSR